MKFYNFKCSSCNKDLSVRYDYYKKHTKMCVSCSKKGNNNAKKHGDCKTRLYGIWSGLKQRRYTYEVFICKEWLLYENFKNWALKNGYKDNLTIDRIYNNVNEYNPNNCMWITRELNAAKDKIIFSNDEKINLFHERKTLKMTQKEFAKFKNTSRNTIQRAEKYFKQQINKNGQIN